MYVKIGERRIFRDDYVGLREDVIAAPSGGVLRRKVVEYQPASAILPVAPDGSILLIEHYRHPIQREMWEIPGGTVMAGEDPAEAAVRELREETGYEAREVRHLATFNPEPAFTNHQIDVFLGADLTNAPHGMVIEDEIKRIAFFAPDEVGEMMRDGRIASSWTVISILLGMRA